MFGTGFGEQLNIALIFCATVFMAVVALKQIPYCYKCIQTGRVNVRNKLSLHGPVTEKMIKNLGRKKYRNIFGLFWKKLFNTNLKKYNSKGTYKATLKKDMMLLSLLEMFVFNYFEFGELTFRIKHLMRVRQLMHHHPEFSVEEAIHQLINTEIGLKLDRLEMKLPKQMEKYNQKIHELDDSSGEDDDNSHGSEELMEEVFYNANLDNFETVLAHIHTANEQQQQNTGNTIAYPTNTNNNRAKNNNFNNKNLDFNPTKSNNSINSRSTNSLNKQGSINSTTQNATFPCDIVINGNRPESTYELVDGSVRTYPIGRTPTLDERDREQQEARLRGPPQQQVVRNNSSRSEYLVSSVFVLFEF